MPPIHPATRLGHVHLAAADLEREITFYQSALGFALHRREDGRAALGTGAEDLLWLSEQRGGRRVQRTTGLYHFAILLPSRRELARAVARLFSMRYPNAPTDHIITKTTYLSDPEGNGIEIYTDTPGEGSWDVVDGAFVVRDSSGHLRSGTEALDVEALLSELRPGDRLDAPAPSETRIGHVHLHVADLREAVRFYHDLLGFDVKIESPAMGVAFVSAGGYHHHIGLNTWAGVGAPLPPPDALGLRYFAIVLPTGEDVDRLVDRARAAGIASERQAEGILLFDPSHNGVLLTTRT